MIDSFETMEKKERLDTYPEKRVELHAHTKMSEMDGLIDVNRMIRTAEKWGHKAVAITDYGGVQAFPEAFSAAKDIKLLYGCEGYLLKDRDLIKEDGSIDYGDHLTSHVIIFAKNKTGLKNLYRLVSLSHLEYFDKRPQIPKSVLNQYREGLILGSACSEGEVYQALLQGKCEDELKTLVEFYDYMEIQPLVNNHFLIEGGHIKDEEALREINRKIVALSEKYNKPVVATCDAHYFDKEEALCYQIIMANQNDDVQKEKSGEGLYFRTTDEMMEEFMYLGQDKAYEVVITNPNKIADEIEVMAPVPEGKFYPYIEGAEEDLRKGCEERAADMYGSPLPQGIQERLDTELNGIIGNGYATIYRLAELIVKKSLSDGYLAGSRGSIGASFAAAMLVITELNPLPPHYLCPNCKNLEWGDKERYECGVDMPDKVCSECGTLYRKEGFNIPFETYLGCDASKEPDIDLNFAGEYQRTAQKHVEKICGKEKVYAAGTIDTVRYWDARSYVERYCEEQKLNASESEIEWLTDHCAGVKKLSGQYSSGVIVAPDEHEICEFCPVQHPDSDLDSDIVTTHFDYHSINKKLLKLDILPLTGLSMLHQLQELTGVNPQDVPIRNDKVLGIFNGAEGLDIKDPEYRFVHGSYGIPDFGNEQVRQMLDEIKPKNFSELVRIFGFTHGTCVWQDNARELVANKAAAIKDVISTRDDIMDYLQMKGISRKDSLAVMNRVRMGKGLTEEQKYLMRENHVPEWYIESCQKIRYLFPRAHAVAYAMMSARIAYYKVYYPVEFYAAYFSAHTKDFNEKVIIKGRKAIIERMDEIQDKGRDAAKTVEDELSVLEVAYEMYARGYEVAPACIGVSDPVKFLVHDGKVLPPLSFVSKAGE